jgi:hypothetical protein
VTEPLLDTASLNEPAHTIDGWLRKVTVPVLFEPPVTFVATGVVVNTPFAKLTVRFVTEFAAA